MGALGTGRIFDKTHIIIAIVDDTFNRVVVGNCLVEGSSCISRKRPGV